ncbi:hypothetical protein MCFN_01740 [Mycoplasmopsis californica]|uniref:tRNA(Met) cytidine acetate ligase n=1 Tax=Mycoplasmopsis californica TaxID=2113 RepID=A0A059XVX3_9BACT|nr:nucleotidyltransferase [Mycoplasmopsis californica]AIA29491.1 hypothetical protein MCFN_01740 [Mycoplasmopsis californica]
MAIGIVAEYNPFHNGHIRQLEWIKANYPGEKIIVVMTDKFTQRGEYSVCSFRCRKKIAKHYGVQKVLKLKFEQTVQAAHVFAENAVLALASQKVDKIVFGSESNDVENMINTAKILRDRKDEFDQIIRPLIKKEKLSYPKAFALALEKMCGYSWAMPNDILGFEYVKAIINNNLDIQPISLQRNLAFHATEPMGKFASASYLRELIKNGDDISLYTPMTIKKARRIEQKYSRFIKILTTTPLNKLRKIPLVTEGIENLLIKNASEPTYAHFVNACVSKRYTASRIKRIIAWILCKKWK